MSERKNPILTCWICHGQPSGTTSATLVPNSSNLFSTIRILATPNGPDSPELGIDQMLTCIFDLNFPPGTNIISCLPCACKLVNLFKIRLQFLKDIHPQAMLQPYTQGILQKTTRIPEPVNKMDIDIDDPFSEPEEIEMKPDIKEIQVIDEDEPSSKIWDATSTTNDSMSDGTTIPAGPETVEASVSEPPKSFIASPGPSFVTTDTTEILNSPKAKRETRKKKLVAIAKTQNHKPKRISIPKVKKRPIKCEICNETIISEEPIEALRLHMETNHRQEQFGIICTSIPNHTPKKRIRKRKIRTISCEVCSWTITTGVPGRGALRLHMELNHGQEPKYTCDICGKPLLSPSIVMSHRKKHRSPEEKKGDKKQRRNYEKVDCDICGVNIYATSLQFHKEKLHAPNGQRKVFFCEQCDFSCLIMISLTKHIKDFHSPETTHKFFCPRCKGGFVRKAQLKEHGLICCDENERPFPCHICSKRFKIKPNLSIHLMEGHEMSREQVREKLYPGLPMPEWWGQPRKPKSVKKTAKTGDTEASETASASRSKHQSGPIRRRFRIGKTVMKKINATRQH